MATKNVSLTAREWLLVWRAVQRAPGATARTSMDDLVRKQRLYMYLKEQIKAHEGTPMQESFGIELSGSRRRMLTTTLLNPGPGREWEQGTLFEVVYPILFELGWTPPNEDLVDEEEEGEEVVV